MKLTKSKNYRIAFPTDIHVPYHDERALSLACQIIKDYKPNVIINGGDACDFYSISRFDKDPERLLLGLQNEIDEFQEVQRQINRAAPKTADRYLLIGNHEDRLRRYLWSNPELATLEALELSNLLGLNKLGMQVAEQIDIGNTRFIHGNIVRKHSGYTAKGSLENNGYAVNMVMGHTHRMGKVYKTRGDGEIVWGVEAGCLCDPEQAKYMSGTANWQRGLVLIDIQDGVAQPELILFHKRSKTLLEAVYRGKHYVSK